MPVFDSKCEKCGHIWEENKRYEDPSQDCPRCGSSFTHTILSGFHTPKSSCPYDALDRVVRDGKTIKSFANDRRKGGRG